MGTRVFHALALSCVVLFGFGFAASPAAAGAQSIHEVVGQFSTKNTVRKQAVKKSGKRKMAALKTKRTKKVRQVKRLKRSKNKTRRVQKVRSAAPRRVVHSGGIKGIIRRHAIKNNVPVKLAFAVVRVESNYRAGVTGPSGSVGLMQIKHATARSMGYRGSRKALYNPETNVKYGMKYLGRAYRLAKGNICGTILRYNAGLGARRMNPISARYCKKVLRMVGTRHINPKTVIAKNKAAAVVAAAQAVKKLQRANMLAAITAVSKSANIKERIHNNIVLASLSDTDTPPILKAPVSPSQWSMLGDPAGKGRIAEKRMARVARAEQDCEDEKKKNANGIWKKIATLLEPVVGPMSRKDGAKSYFGISVKYSHCG